MTDSPFPLSASFVRTIREVYGDRGDAWLLNLPALVADCERRWSLAVGPHFPTLSYNFAAPARRADGTPCVLKLGVPNPEISSEIEALRAYDGRGICRLYDADPDAGVLVLERLEPGVMLSTLADDAQAVSIAARLMRLLRRPPPPGHGLPDLARWTRALPELRARHDGTSGPLPPDLYARAEGLLTDLLASAPAPVLLHGDLHHFNILTARRAPWLAIDPKGIAGDPAFETTAFLYNPEPQDAPTLARRVAQFAEELDLDQERVRAWGVAFGVLSACWTLEDHGHGWRPAVTIAERLAL